MKQTSSTEPYRILIVADALTRIDTTVEYFHQHAMPHCQFQAAISPLEFETLLQQRVWDLILCSYLHIPFETTDLLQSVRQIQPQTPVIVIGEQLTTQEAFELGRLGVHELIETVDTQHLLASVQQILSAKQMSGLSGGGHSSAAQQLELILDSMQEAIMSVSLPDRHLIFVSSSYERVFGYQAKAFLEDPNYYKQVMLPEEVDMGTAALRTISRDGFIELDHRVIWPNGEVHWLHRRAWIVYDPEGIPVQLVDTARDITKRKQAEDALRRSEAYLRSLVNSEAAFNVRVDMQGKISYCNERYRRQFAWAAPSIIGLDSLAVVHPDDQPKVFEAVAKCVALPSRTVQLEIRKVTESGGYIWTLWEFSSVASGDGTVQEIHCVGFDITKQKQAEAALQEANRELEQRIRERTAELQEERNLLRTVIDAIPDYIYMKDRQHRMQLNNAAYIREAGVQNGAALIGKTDFDVLPAELAVQFHADEDRLFETEQAIINLEEHGFKLDGSEAWMLTTKVPLRSLQGEVVGLVGITRDITSIKAASEALRLSEARYRATVAAMSEGLVVHGKEGAIELCNSAAEQMLGLTAEQMIGRTSVDSRWRAIHEDGSPFLGETHPAMVTLRTGAPQSNVVMGIHKADDTLTWLLINSQSLINPLDQKPSAVVVTFANITAPKEAEAAIKATLAREKELGELKSRFVSMASHEFRTPLASILAVTETLSVYWERMDKAKINDRLNRVRAQVSRMTEIIDDVLQLTRMQTGRTKFEPAPSDLDALCMQIVNELTDLPDYHNRIRYACSQRPLNAIFDQRLLQQIIINLLHNALKYSPPETSVQITLSQTNGQITLRIEDEGIGIPTEDLKRLFEPFHRAANVGAISGTGLGLVIAKEAIELHGGSITVESEVNVGTTFIVTLPDQL
ncbi:MAG: PAS domain S-box protein [Anaerolineae bacterium]